MNNQTQEFLKRWHRGLERRDLDSMLSCYDENAEIRVVDRFHPPSSPMTIRGKNAIQAYFGDIFKRDLFHKIESEVVSENRVAFTDTCQYANGSKVIANEICELRDGKVLKQVTVQAWDE
jgi:ketosteroid isomerase-like protein